MMNKKYIKPEIIIEPAKLGYLLDSISAPQFGTVDDTGADDSYWIVVNSKKDDNNLWDSDTEE